MAHARDLAGVNRRRRFPVISTLVHWQSWIVPLLAALIAVIGAVVSGASPFRVAVALAVLYAAGTVTGSLLVVAGDDDADGIPWAIIRLIAGLLLSTLSFFLSLVLSLPWYVGPVALVLAAMALRRRAAFSLPKPHFAFTFDGVVAGVLATVLMLPLAISALRMTPGDYPPVFFNVDTPYSLEHVHSLVQTRVYPPESLSNLGGRRSYHVGVQGIAALISRTSGLAPHHSLFLIVLPLLAAGITAAAVAARQRLCPALPAAVAVPMLIVAVPSLWYSFWSYIGPRLWIAGSKLAGGPIDAVIEYYELWGVASNVAQNVGAQFVTLAAVAAIAAAPSRGWRLPVFLIGTALIVKTSTGIALLAGLLLAQAYRAAVARRFEPLVPAAAAAAVFAATYVAFWVVPPVQAEYATELFPLFYLKRMAAREGLWLAFDLVWLLLPAVVVLGTFRLTEAQKGSLPLLLFGLAPLLVVNLTRTIDVRPGAGGATEDWIQIILPVPFLLHAFALSFVGQGWTRLGARLRAAVIVVMALSVVPAAFVAGRYSLVLIRDPENGHEFADNRSIAAALAAIPLEGSIIVTNDLRYPAQQFARPNRQLQIPALFGHQAFAVNYQYEIFGFSRERRELQSMLQASDWSDAIERDARKYHWTHFLVRKDYMHPRPIPLEQIFENDSYSVYRFK
jgi:hypothetical protein